MNEPSYVQALVSELGKDKVVTEDFKRSQYTYALAFEIPVGMPDVIVLPESTEDCRKIVAIANRFKPAIPITPVGARTMWPDCASRDGGILIDTTRMDRILDIDEETMTCTVQAGVIIGRLDRELRARGYYYPVHASNAGRSTVAADVAKNTIGSFGCDAAPFEGHIISLRVVLGNGEVLDTGASAAVRHHGKRFVRYGLPDVTGLFCSSEGALGIITEVTLRLSMMPVAARYLDVEFPDTDEGIEGCTSAVRELLARKLMGPSVWLLHPHAVSWLLRAWEWSKKGQARPDDMPVSFGEHPPDKYGHRLCFTVSSLVSEKECDARRDGALEVCGRYGGKLLGGEIAELIDSHELIGYFYTKTEAPMHSISSGLYPCVGPPWKLPEVYRKTLELWEKEKEFSPPEMWYPYVNFYPFIALYSYISHYDAGKEAEQAVEKSMQIAAEQIQIIMDAGGYVPYPVGKGVKSLVPDLFTPEYEALMKKVKAEFDPNNIMNPGNGPF